MRIDASGVRVEVRDDGEPAAAAPPGYGISGMIERATLLGGTCEAGPARRRVGRDRRAPARGLVGVNVRVLIADDQELVRTGLRMILDAQPDIEVVGEARTAPKRWRSRAASVPMCASSTSGCR